MSYKRMRSEISFLTAHRTVPTVIKTDLSHFHTSTASNSRLLLWNDSSLFHNNANSCLIAYPCIKISGGSIASDLYDREPGFRCVKNAFIASVTLTSRAAVRGGLSYEYALNLSDFYIRSVEMMDSQDKILPFLGQMMMDYCERVMDLSLPERASPLTQAAIREIRADLREKLTVETLAETLHCSRSSLSHTFSREMKMSVSNYITICKIEEAKRLLKQGLRISETAQELGFSSQTHFQNVFRRVTGTTPANFQKHPSNC